MEERKIKNVSCPCCKKSLYRLSLAERHGGAEVWLATIDSPRVENDKEGYFIKCVHCSKRIAMIEVPGIPNAAFDVSPEQNAIKYETVPSFVFRPTLRDSAVICS